MSYEKTPSQPAWSKGLLITFWVLQTLFILLEIGVYSVALAAISQYTDSNGSISTSNGTTTVSFGDKATIPNRNAIVAVCAVFLLLAILFFVFHLVEWIQYGRKRMTAKLYFGFELTKSIVWTIIFALDVAGTLTGSGSGVFGLIVNIGIELLFLASMIYASVMFHRYRKEKNSLGEYSSASTEAAVGGSTFPPYSSHQGYNNTARYN